MHETTIPSLHKFLTRATSLQHRENRDHQNAFFIEGIRNFIQAFDANFPFEAILYSQILCTSDLAEMLTRRLVARGIPRIRLTPEQFRTISLTERASGIAAILRQRWTPLDSVDPARGLAWLVVEEIRTPGNLGTILRTAEAAGASGVIFIGPKTDPYDPNILRASMGGIFHLPLIRATHDQLARWALTRRVQLVGLAPEAKTLWTHLPSNTPIALLIGEERHGLSHTLRALCNTTIRLPMTGHADSLNVATATAIVLYELVRRTQP